MAKLYLSNKTRTSHTFQFYEERQNDPKWRDDYLRIKAERKSETLKAWVWLLVVIIIVLSIFSFAFLNTQNHKETGESPAPKMQSSTPSEQVSSSETTDNTSEDNLTNQDFDKLPQKMQLAMLLSVYYTSEDVTTLVYMSHPNEIIFDNPNIAPIRYIDEHNGLFEIYLENGNNGWIRSGQISKGELLGRYYSNDVRKDKLQKISDSINISYSSEEFPGDK